MSDPLTQLRNITNNISPINDDLLRSAVVLSQPKFVKMGKIIDPLHVTDASKHIELNAEIIDTMKSIQIYKETCELFSYDWNINRHYPKPFYYQSLIASFKSISSLIPRGPHRGGWIKSNRSVSKCFDFDSLDPFHGSDIFDNGEIIGYWIKRYYFLIVKNAIQRWPQPTHTDGDSYWNWLLAPSSEALLNQNYPPQTLTNLMWLVYSTRQDLMDAFKDIVNKDRIAFVEWFLGSIISQSDFCWFFIYDIEKTYYEWLKCKILNNKENNKENKRTPTLFLTASAG